MRITPSLFLDGRECPNCFGEGDDPDGSVCSDCHGTGYKLTEIGEQLIDFLTEHLGIELPVKRRA